MCYCFLFYSVNWISKNDAGKFVPGGKPGADSSKCSFSCEAIVFSSSGVKQRTWFSFNVLLCLAIVLKRVCKVVDVKTAFLNAYMEDLKCYTW